MAVRGMMGVLRESRRDYLVALCAKGVAASPQSRVMSDIDAVGLRVTGEARRLALQETLALPQCDYLVR